MNTYHLGNHRYTYVYLVVDIVLHLDRGWDHKGCIHFRNSVRCSLHHKCIWKRNKILRIKKLEEKNFSSKRKGWAHWWSNQSWNLKNYNCQVKHKRRGIQIRTTNFIGKKSSSCKWCFKFFYLFFFEYLLIEYCAS